MRQPERLPHTSHVLLGLLAGQPMAGYELGTRITDTVAHFWPVTRTQVYGELGRLADLGYVTGQEVEQQKRPDKVVYSLTPTGRAALQRWLDDPAIEPERRRNQALLKFFFSDELDRDQLAELVDGYRALLEQERDGLARRLEGLLDEDGRLLGSLTPPKATALFGLRRTEAALSWLQEVGPALLATGGPGGRERARGATAGDDRSSG